MPAAVARRTRYDTPKWAADILGDNPGPAEFDRVQHHEQARKLPRDTDPDTIDDPDVRDAFLSQMQDDVDKHGTRPATNPAPARRPTRGTASRGLRVPFASSLGSAVFGIVVYAIGVNFVRGGGAQVKRWMSAKFTNGGGKLP